MSSNSTDVTLARPVVHMKTALADALVWDNHTCTTVSPGKPESLAYLRRYRDIGVDVVTLNVGFDPVPPENAIRLLADFRRWIRQHPDEFTLVASAADIDAARRTGRLGICFNIEGGNALFGQSSMVSLYYELGVRWMLFAYNHSNALAGGCEDVDNGLTPFGREVQDEMERVGMVLCCSHIGHRSAAELLERARQPVIFSHSNPSGVWPHARNIGDGLMRACARTGGVVGINGIGVFLGENDASVRTISQHVRYAVDLVGPDHVAIGLDYAFDQQEVQEFVKAHPETYPPEKYPRGLAMAEPECLPELAQSLLTDGLSEADVRKIFGENLRRIAIQVWK